MSTIAMVAAWMGIVLAAWLGLCLAAVAVFAAAVTITRPRARKPPPWHPDRAVRLCGHEQAAFAAIKARRRRTATEYVYEEEDEW